MTDSTPSPLDGIAIIGLAGRFPGAESISAFWENLLAGRETISTISRDTLPPEEPKDDPDYVPRRGILKDPEAFDAGFFGMKTKEAEGTDPQQRLFLEGCWHALEDAGIDPGRYSGLIGVYAGMSNNSYFLSQVEYNEELRSTLGPDGVMMGNEKDYLATRVAYKLNLRGPALNIYTACSTSLVSVCQAVSGLQSFQCDLALAGGVSVKFPQERGYLHQEGSIYSPDGHCRSFDENARGTVFSSGMGAVVLKRLEDAVRDGDRVYAVIKSAAINNDGADKVSFMAPSVNGHAEVISLAHALANVDPATIGYVECHGTATPIGDPIEIAGLTQAFRSGGAEGKSFCAIGSVKSNIGHTDAAAGVIGLIKAALMLHHRTIPASLHFQRPNPALGIEDSPFFVNTETRPWPQSDHPRRAGVSSFGLGGTNAHAVLEEAPPPISSSPGREEQVLLLSGQSPAALSQLRDEVIATLEKNATWNLADVSWTTQLGRQEMPHRSIVVASSAKEAAEKLRANDGREVYSQAALSRNVPVAFLFPGQGSQHLRMGVSIARQEPVFATVVNECCERLRQWLDVDLRELLDPAPGTEEEAERKLGQTRYTQPALFVTEYAMAKLLESWGVEPACMLGHSIGEYVAACLAGVFSLEDALHLVAERGRILWECAPGGMLAVKLAESAVRESLPAGLDVATINGPTLTVVAGPHDVLESFEKALAERQVTARRLVTSHAFHSTMMEPALEKFRAVIAAVKLSAPARKYISNITGRQITDLEATSPDYYVRHIRSAVRFSDGVAAIMESGPCVLLEVGPGQALAPLAKQHPAAAQAAGVISALPPAKDAGRGEYHELMKALGRIWLAGANVDWMALHDGETRRKVDWPLYPFQRQKFCGSRCVPTGAQRTGESSLFVPMHATLAGPTGQARAAVIEAQSPAMVAEQAPSALSRRDFLIAELRRKLHEASGIDLATAAENASLFDLGFDSLFLTQASLFLKKYFGVKITFRQLAEELGCLKSLAEYLDQQLPPDKFSPASAVPQVQLAEAMSAETSGSGSVAERLFAMERNLAALRQDLQSLPQATATGRSGWLVPVKHQSAGLQKNVTFGPFRPLQTTKDGSLTEQQRKHLDELIAAYTARTPSSKAYTQKHRAHFADPRAVSGFNHLWKEAVYPIVTNKSKGAKMWDIDGNEWLDITLGFGPMFLGHAPDFVVEAVQKQLHEGFENGPTSPLAGEVAELMLEFSGMDRVGFCNTGSEAVMAALRMSRTVTGRDKVVTFAGDYHGIFDEVLFRPQIVNGELRSAPIAPGIPECAGDNILVLDYGNPESLEIIRQQAGEIAAVLIETVRSRDPENQPAQFLHELREITAASGTALIFDEVVTGFRSHYRGAQGWFGIEADIATYGKVVGGGLPIGMVAGKRRFMDALDGGHWQYGDDSGPEVGVTFFAGTFVRHPLALAAAKAVLQFLKEKGPSLQEEINAKTEKLVERLNGIAERAGVPIRYQRFSSFFYPAFAPAIKYVEPFYLEMRKRGIYTWSGRPSFLSIAHTETDFDRVAEAFRESVESLQTGGFLPLPAVSGQPADFQAAAPAPIAQLNGKNGTHHHSVAKNGTAMALPPTVALGKASSGRVAVTPAQQELFLASQVSPEASTACHESLTLHLRGPLKGEVLELALQQLVLRHESLRAKFSDDGAEMIWNAGGAMSLPFADLSGDAVSDKAGQLEEIERQEFMRPFDLLRGPLFRAKLVKMGADDHRLILAAHHLICDGWSFGVLADELPKLYAQLVGLPLAELREPESFANYANEQAEARRRGEFEADRRYWLGQYASPPGPLNLPGDFSSGILTSFDTAAVRMTLPGELAERVKQFCKERRLTPFHLLLTAWELVLHRLSGAEDFAVGVPFAGQSAVGAHGLCGHCVQFLPIRAQIPDGATVAQCLEETRQAMLAAVDNQNFTLGEILEALPQLSAEDRMKFVRTVFSLETVPSDMTVGELQVRLIPGAKRRAFTDLILFGYQHRDGIDLQCTFKRELFARETIARWLDHFQVVLQEIMKQPEAFVARLPMLSPAQRTELVTTFNESGCADYPQRTVHELFAEQVTAFPEAVAVEMRDQSLTYAELDAKSNALALLLRDHEVTPDQPVLVLMDRSLELIVAILGILKAGGAYLPIEPNYPEDRIRMMLSDSGAKLLLTQKKLKPAMQAGVTCLVLDEEWPGNYGERSESPLSPVNHPDDLAYILYTSGSTGTPKGVPVPHRAIVRLVRATNYATFGPDRIWLLAGALSFDATTLEIWGALLNGGKLVILPPDEVSLEGIGAILRRHGVTSLWLTSGLFQLMVDERLEDLVGVRELLTGGDVVSMQHAKKALDKLTSTTLINGYGPTENTTFSACHRITSADLQRSSLPIGKPIAHSTCYVLDAHGELCPIGVPGELHVGGDGLSHGYWKRPDLTAEMFIEDPFGGKLGARLYRTGDLVRWLDGGVLEFLGRIDSQVKIRGFRIEPSEVESHLCRHPAVAQACVVAHGQGAAEKRLIAFVQPRLGSSPQAKELQVFLRDRVPDYMVPSVILALDKLPLTPNGKVDRRSLLVPLPLESIEDDESPADDWVEPETTTQKRLSALWQAVLGRNHIGVGTDFFAAGGTSLNGLKLFTSIRQEFGLALPLGTLFRNSTLEKLAAVIDSACQSGQRSVSPITCLQPAGAGLPIFCVHGGDGGALFFGSMVPAWGTDHPLYAIEAPALVDDSLPVEPKSVEQVAADYLKYVRSVQPRGPYMIGGYSYGGIVAYEMARQVIESGDEMQLLVLFDTDSPNVELRQRSFAERIAVNWRSSESEGIAGRLLKLGSRLGTGLVQRIRYEAETAAAKRLAKKGLRPEDERLRFVQIREEHVESIQNYRAQPYPGTMLLLRSEAVSDKFELAEDYGWTPLVDRLLIEHITGDHLDIFDEPHVSAMVKKLRPHLEAASLQTLPA